MVLLTLHARPGVFPCHVNEACMLREHLALQVEPFRPQMAHLLCRIAPSPITMPGSWEEQLLQTVLTHILRTVNSLVRMLSVHAESVLLPNQHTRSEALQSAVQPCGDPVNWPTLA